MLNLRYTYSVVMTDCLFFDSIALTFASQTFILVTINSVITRSTNISPMPTMILSVSSSRNFGAHSISNKLRVSSSSLVRTNASWTDWGSHYIPYVMIMWVNYLISRWFITLKSKYTVVPSVLKGMNTFLWAIPSFQFSSSMSSENDLPVIHVLFVLMSNWYVI